MFVKAVIGLLLCIWVNNSPISVEKIREDYKTASKSKENAQKFYNLLHEVPDNGSLLAGYAGAARMMHARYEKNRATLLKEGKKYIENAVKSNENSVEIRFIRLSVQENLPKIVPYRQNIEEDKQFLLENLKKEPYELQNYIKNYIKSSKIFTEEEKNQLL